MFKTVSPKLNVTVLEEGILRYWRNHEVFQRTLSERAGGPEYVFYEGPPTANGRPGVHHVLARAFKDIFPRYKIMRGYHVIRRGGWDTHGLPVEIEVEKKLGFTNKQQIEDFGIAKFNELCRESAFTYIQDWERLTERIAFWVDLKTAYVTYTNEYIESVWWILKNFWDKNLIYRGFKVVPYCPRCGTPLSDHEVALGYDEATDPSVYVRLPLVDTPGTSLLVWTTTPWTLPANVAVAAHPEVEYVTVERELAEGGSERLILAEALLTAVFGEEEVRVVERMKGSALRGKRYQPLFTFLPPDRPAHRVVLADFVTIEDGSGLVHIAPAFGEDDMATARRHDLELTRSLIEQHSRGLSLYRCDSCGFRARQFYWHCPACHGWETYVPRRAEERELVAAEGSCKHLREIEDANACEWLAHSAAPLSFMSSASLALAICFWRSNSALRRAISSADRRSRFE